MKPGFRLESPELYTALCPSHQSPCDASAVHNHLSYTESEKPGAVKADSRAKGYDNNLRFCAHVHKSWRFS